MKYKARCGHGWDIEEIYPLNHAVHAFSEMERDIYELRNCVRTISLVGMRDRLKRNAETIVEAMESINDGDEIEDYEEEL